ncbi:hypothetical protein SAMN05216188_12855 [Lentzea xinjiangensis]|uniref:Uncharacterized protein n=1 Tax=Lentzea xinjiangensis TaxID=402600 RepID=A0A1H9VW32_9PSEU|nr:hypothetical protein [Lentzea xinjiangensis]SES25721.1 hypothetical protein SAMN05216188_12855 [Lentzea xinjiangensis]
MSWEEVDRIAVETGFSGVVHVDRAGEVELANGDGGIHTTAGDLAKFWRALFASDRRARERVRVRRGDRQLRHGRAAGNTVRHVRLRFTADTGWPADSSPGCARTPEPNSPDGALKTETCSS